MWVAGGRRAAQVGGDGLGRRADVEREADRRQRAAAQVRAQLGGQPAWAGQGVGGQCEHGPAQPLPGVRGGGGGGGGGGGWWRGGGRRGEGGACGGRRRLR